MAKFILTLIAALLVSSALAPALVAQSTGPDLVWRWAAPADGGIPERIALRGLFQWPEGLREARLLIAADNRYDVFWQERRIAVDNEWRRGRSVALPVAAGEKQSLIAIRGTNQGGPAGMLLAVEAVLQDGKLQRLEPVRGWRAVAGEPEGWMQAAFDDAAWPEAQVVARFGEGPWGRETHFAPPERFDFDPRPGFQVELLAEGIGSLISMTVDPEGRPIVGVEAGGVLRLEDQDGDGRFEHHEEFAPEMQAVQGLLVHEGRLWMVGTGPQSHGLYARAANDPKSPLEHWGRFGGTGEHGPHAVLADPKGRLWIALGNHTPLLEPVSPDSPYRGFIEGHPIPVRKDPLGHAATITAPGGTIVCFDPRTKEWWYVFGGLRNAYDMAFDPTGRLFAYDSDMEWDIGLPWYRPTRLVQVVAGADNGWRTGSSKWPEGRFDAWPAAIEAGRGSPTGVLSAHDLAFPSRWRSAILGGDWAQGRILAFFPTAGEDTATRGTVEVLLSGRPLNVTDFERGKDGSLWFTCGGRASRGGLFALRWVGPPEEVEARAIPPAPITRGQLSDRLRVREAVFGADRPQPPRAEVLEALSGQDTARRWLAILELREQPLTEAERATAESTLVGRLALAHADLLVDAAKVGDERVAALLVEAPPTELAIALRLAQLARLHQPTLAWPMTEAALARLAWPGDRLAWTELVYALGAQGGPTARPRLLAALAQETEFARRVLLADALSARGPLTDAADIRIVTAFAQEAARVGGGRSVRGFVEAILRDLGGPDEDLAESLLDAFRPTPTAMALPTNLRTGSHDPERLLAYVHAALPEARRDRHVGALVYEQACARCHRHGDRGLGLGPDLTTVGSRFGIEDLAQALLAPSRVISDQYRSLEVLTDEGLILGMPLEDTAEALAILTPTGEVRRFARSRIESLSPARLSSMPEGTLDPYSLEEVADLFHFLLTSGPATPPPARPWLPANPSNPSNPSTANPTTTNPTATNPTATNPRTAGTETPAAGLSTSAPSAAPAPSAAIAQRLEGTPEAPAAPVVLGSVSGDFTLQVEVRLVRGAAALRLGIAPTTPADAKTPATSKDPKDRTLPQPTPTAPNSDPLQLAGGLRVLLGGVRWASVARPNTLELLQLAPEVDWRPNFVEGAWNHLLIEVRGRTLRTALNGIPCALLETDLPLHGLFAFEAESSSPHLLEFQNPLLRPLPPTPH